MVIKNTFLRLLGHQRQQQTMKRQTYEMTPGFKPFIHYAQSYFTSFLSIVSQCIAVRIGPLQLAILVVQNHHAETKVALGQDKQGKFPFKIMYAFCWSCPSATFASQHDGFVPCEWQTAKGLLSLETNRSYSRKRTLYSQCALACSRCSDSRARANN